MMKRLIIHMIYMLLSSCGGPEDYGPDPVQQPNPPPTVNTPTKPDPTVIECPTGTTHNYKNFGRAFFSTYCTMCHSQYLTNNQRGNAPAHLNLEKYDTISSWRKVILDRITTPNLNPMPPSGLISPNDFNAAIEWLKCGAP